MMTKTAIDGQPTTGTCTEKRLAQVFVIPRGTEHARHPGIVTLIKASIRMLAKGKERLEDAICQLVSATPQTGLALSFPPKRFFGYGDHFLLCRLLLCSIISDLLNLVEEAISLHQACDINGGAIPGQCGGLKAGQSGRGGGRSRSPLFDSVVASDRPSGFGGVKAQTVAGPS